MRSMPMPPTKLRVSRRTLSLLAVAVVLAAAGAALVAAQPSDASTPAVVDSQAFLGAHLPPAADGGPHRPPRLSKRVADLLARMTLREKVGQMTQLTVAMVASGR